MLDEVGDASGVSHFVIIPHDDLDKLVSEGNAGLQVVAKL